MQCDTQSQTPAYVFLWKIENFLLNACSAYESMISPVFTVEAFSNTKWSLWLFPYEVRGGNYISCYLERKDDDGPEKFSVGFDISFVTADGQAELAHSVKKYNFEKLDSSETSLTWKWNDLLQKRNFYFPNDSFTIRCRLWTCLTEKLVSNTCTALTHIEVMKTSFKKTIYNFSAVFSSNEVTFPVTFSPKLKIAIYMGETSADYLTIDIIKCGESVANSQMILLVCKLSILDANGITLDFKEDRHLFKSKEINAVWKFSPFIKVQKLKEESILFNDTLNLLFQFSQTTGKIMSYITECVPTLQMVDDRLSRTDPLKTDLERLLVEKKFSDVKLKSGTEILPAHKAILCARSTVFAAMFESDMYENESGLVDIKDVDASTLYKMLVFMYTGNIEDIFEEKTAVDLLFAADKYQVISLKEKCSSFLKRNITVDNVIRILLLADLHQEEVLKMSAQEFICDHKQEILSSEEWKDFVTEHITLASELVYKLSLKYINA